MTNENFSDRENSYYKYNHDLNNVLQIQCIILIMWIRFGHVFDELIDQIDPLNLVTTQREFFCFGMKFSLIYLLRLLIDQFPS